MNTMIHGWNQRGGILRLGILSLMAVFLASQPGAAESNLEVSVGEAITVNAEKVAKLAVADPTIADVIPLSETEISVIGKAAGVTTLTVVHEEGIATEMFRVEVSHGAGVRSIHETLGHPGVMVSEIGDSVVLEGKVETEQEAERAAKIAAAYKPNVVNLLEVKNPRQVRIKTRFVEVRTDAVKRLGIDYFGPDGQVIYGMDYDTIQEPDLGDVLTHGFFPPTGNVSGFDIEATLNALAQKESARILAQPTLVTLSGKEASFLSGGEVPIVQQLADTFTVEFKEFGVLMNIKPVVDSDHNIATHIMTEVSSVAAQVSVAGIPQFRTRRTETDVKVKDGQTIVISGLLNNQHDRDAIRKVPWLGDIPVLGALFRSKAFQGNITELVVFVTPSVVKDIDADVANAIRTPDMKDWNYFQADEQIDTRQRDADDYPRWQKPLEVDEFEPVVRVEPPPAPADEGAVEMEGEADADKNFEPARPAGAE
jgi:pilus assembly protein CpaC